MRCLVIHPEAAGRQRLETQLSGLGHDVSATDLPEMPGESVEVVVGRLPVTSWRSLLANVDPPPLAIALVSADDDLAALSACGVSELLPLDPRPEELALRLRLRALQERPLDSELPSADQLAFRDLVENAPVGVFVTTGRTLTYANQAFLDIVGYPSFEAIRRVAPNQLVAKPAQLDALKAQLERGVSVRTFEVTVVTERGRHRRLLLSADVRGTSAHGVVVDATHVRRVEADLRATEELAERLIEAVPGGIAYVGGDGSIGRINAEAARLLNAGDADELMGADQSVLFGGDVRDERNRELSPAELPSRRALTTGLPQGPTTLAVRRRDGTNLWGLFRAVPVRDPDSESTSGTVLTFLDVTDQKRAEERLRESESRYRQLVEGSPEPIAIVVGGKLRFVNQASVDLLGAGTADELLDQPLLSFFERERHEELERRMRELLAGTRLPPAEERMLRRDGRPRVVELSTAPVLFEGQPALQVVARDITARREAEDQLRRFEAQMQHTQKLESLGILAGGIAHDFNNLLAAIIGNVDLGRAKIADPNAMQTILSRIDVAAQRATDLTQQMLAYSGKGKLSVRALSLTQLVSEMAELLGTVISKSATLVRSLNDVPAVEGDAAQLQQVVMNLITNASDALGDAPGEIHVGLSVAHVTRALLRDAYLDEGLPEGSYVCLEVRDTGAGMSTETKRRIFDPFFTTKATGRGLGLAATLGIVRGHGGTIHIDSQPGHGTRFRVFLPPVGQGVVSTPKAPVVAPAQCRGTVLVVDDEPLVLEVTRAQLEDLGYRVLTAEGGTQAVERFEAKSSSIDIVVLDMTMPDLRGDEVMRRLKEIDPNVRVLVTSGYSEEEAVARLGEDELAGFLQKPYSQATLSRHLRQVLER